MKKLTTLILSTVLCLGCVTTDSTPRQIARQIKLVESLEKANDALLDTVKENKERLEKAKADLEALKVQHTIETEEEVEVEQAGG